MATFVAPRASFVLGLVSVGLLAGASGCVGLLGDFKVEEAIEGSSDGGGEDTAPAPPHDGGARDSGLGDSEAKDSGAIDSGPHDAHVADTGTLACAIDGDCAHLTVPGTLPAACAVFVCEAHACALVSKDHDGDGHRSSACASKSGEPIAVGDDCDDNDPSRYPGNWDGPNVPGDPSRPDRCSDHVDHNCDGVAGDDVFTVNGATTTCTCAPNDRRKCGSGPLGCPGGTQVCGNDGHWGACSGASPAFDDSWNANFGAAGNGWASSFGDPYVDVANNRLRLSYDDIVTRNAPISGSYYVTHDLTLSGGTVFTPTVYVDAPFLPSMRRSGSDMQLGGDSYAGSWSDAQPPGFAGKVVTGVLTAHVTTYVKAQSKELAVKVEAGGAVYRSGWTPPFTWPQTNAAIFRLMGQNNSSIFSGSDDYIYIGPLHGCSAMDEAEVDASYQQ